MKRRLSCLLLVAGLLQGPAYAGALVDLAAEASRPAANDLLRASVYSEASGSNPGELARRVNGDIAEALKVIHASKGVTVKSGQQSTYPVYSPAQKIDSWRMRSELILESRDSATVSALLGKLQQLRLLVGNISQLPSPETRRQVEDETTREAIRAFQNRAEVVAGQLGKGWKIKQLTIQQQGSNVPMPMMRATRAMAMAESAMPAPLEAGESQITTSVSGQIELAD